jgi:hypothetical protein
MIIHLIYQILEYFYEIKLENLLVKYVLIKHFHSSNTELSVVLQDVTFLATPSYITCSSFKANSHIPCSSHAFPLPCHDHAVLKATSQGHGTALYESGMGTAWYV